MKSSLHYFGMKEADMYITALEYTLEKSTKIEFDKLSRYLRLFIHAFKNKQTEKVVFKFSENMPECKTDAETKELNFVEVNYVPHVVDVADLNENGNLYSQEMQQAIHALNLKVGARTSKEQLQEALQTPLAKWSVVRTPAGYTTIYRGLGQGYDLGKGTYAFTKVLQNFDNTFFAIKIIPTTNEKSCDGEVVGLKAAGQFILDYFRKNKTNARWQKEILMDFAPGVNLHYIYSSNRKLAIVHWLDICLSVADELDNLHKKNIVHGDLSGGNYIVNLMSSKTKLVDFGVSKDLTCKLSFSDIAFALDPVFYMAPECTRGCFSYQSDIYSLGVLLALILRLGHCFEKSNRETFVLNSATYPNPHLSDRLESKEQSKKLQNFIRKMMEWEPWKRPTLKETKDILNEIRKTYQNTPHSTLHIAYVEVDLYQTCAKNVKYTLIKWLRNKDQVYFFDIDGKHKKSYVKLQQQLEENSIFYSSTILIATEMNVKSVLAAHITQIKQSSPPELQQYHFEYVDKSNISTLGETLDKPGETSKVSMLKSNK